MILNIRFNQLNKNLLGLALASAILLGFSFPPFPLGILTTVGFVPFLVLADSIHSFGRFFRYSYFTFFIFCIITLYWVGGFTHLKDPYLMLAGGALLLWQPLFFSIPASLYYIIKKSSDSVYGVISFPFIWLTFEWMYALGEFAFPWLTIGNSQTYNLEKIQFIEITGVYGLSLWILGMNILVYLLLHSIWRNKSSKQGKYLIVAILVWYLAPNFYSLTVNKQTYVSPSQKGITIGIVQPNVDPWDKWQGANTFQGRWQQAESYLTFMKDHVNKKTDMILLPESAILLNLPALADQYFDFKKETDSLNVAVISGYAKVTYYEANEAPVSSSIIKGTNIHYDSFNSIFFIEPGTNSVQTYSKMRLVPFAERIPYADDFPFLIEPLRWGVGISNWGLGRDSTIFFSQKVNAHFLAMICYESIFPEFVSRFVDKGAEFLVFITNDSWWGNTSGARQHQQYAVLRAIENRRWVARCANGGISSFIDPYGDEYDKTSMYTQTYIERKIYAHQEKTFYTKHGDWLARICASVTLFIILFTISYQFILRKK